MCFAAHQQIKLAMQFFSMFVCFCFMLFFDYLYLYLYMQALKIILAIIGFEPYFPN